MKSNYWFQQISACVDHHYGFPPSSCQFTNKKSQNVPKKFILLAAEENLVYRQKQNVRKCVRNSEKSTFPFHIYILLHRLQVFMETDTRPSVNLNEGASNVQVMFDPNPLNKCCIVHFCKLQMSSNRDNAVLPPLSWHKGCWEISWCCHTCVVLISSWHVMWWWYDSKCGRVEQTQHLWFAEPMQQCLHFILAGLWRRTFISILFLVIFWKFCKNFS